MRKPLRRMLLPALAAVAIAAGGATAPASAAEKFIFAHPMNVDHVFHAISERYMAALADNAAVELEYHPGGRSRGLDVALRAGDAGGRPDDPHLGVVGKDIMDQLRSIVGVE